MVCLIGADGSMGKRYQAILNWLRINYRAFDKKDGINNILSCADDSTHTIIATPTHTHLDFLDNLIPMKTKILCEKPVTKNLEELEKILATDARHGSKISMMFQYGELVHSTKPFPSIYNYFRHGSDGLTWDCLQVIALAEGEVEIRDDSPIWTCEINGQALRLGDMDLAYLTFVQKWLNGSLNQRHTDIYRAHEKVRNYIKEMELNDDLSD